jgi:hypothetical protein
MPGGSFGEQGADGYGDQSISSELVDEIVLTAPATSITFTGLDGDAQVAYQIRAYLLASSTATYLHCRPNGDNGANYHWYLHAATGAVQKNPAKGLHVGQYTAPANASWCVAELTAARTTPARNRLYVASGLFENVYPWQIGGSWRNSADKITSLVFTAVDASEVDKVNGLAAGTRISIWARAI